MMGVILRDITARKIADEALRQSESQFRAFAETSPDAIIMTDIDMTVLYWNAAAETIFGYSRQEMLGRPADCVMVPGASHQVGASVHGLGPGEVSPYAGRTIEVLMVRKDGREIPCELSFFQWETATQIFLGAIVRDITERKRIQAETVRAAHLASIGELAAGVAHEINNPINGIINCADILKHQCEKKGGDPDIPLRIMKEGERVADIVKNLLTFARERRGKMEPHGVSAIWADAFALMAKQFEKNAIAVHVDIPEGLPPVVAQPQQIQQVFINLLSNARYALHKKYPDRDPGKRLDVTAQAVTAGGQPLVRIVFHDRGTGMPRADMEKLCNPFFSTKPPGEGTGLGLSISYKIVKDHGGSMVFESGEGEFMRVTVDLPAAAG
jgi:PAS domain S-box-containing protein